MRNPRDEHLVAAKTVLRYLKEKVDLCVRDNRVVLEDETHLQQVRLSAQARGSRQDRRITRQSQGPILADILTKILVYPKLKAMTDKIFNFGS